MISAVQQKTHAEENKLLSDLVLDPINTVLVVSDLHLSIGRDQITGTFESEKINLPLGSIVLFSVYHLLLIKGVISEQFKSAPL